MKRIIFVILFLLCVFKPVNAVCEPGYFDSDDGAGEKCDDCLTWCSTCNVGWTCTACATNSNRIVWLSTATDCAYLF